MLECREEFNVTRTWFDVEMRIQQAQIRKNLPALNVIKEENRSVVAQSTDAAGEELGGEPSRWLDNPLRHASIENLEGE